MSMSKKDFEDIATDLRIDRNNLIRQGKTVELQGFDIAVASLLAPFSRANSNFDRDRFLDWVEREKA